MSSLEHRLECLEKSNRRLRVLAALPLAGLLALGAMGADQPAMPSSAEVIRAGRLEIVDAAGQVVLSLDTSEAGGRLRILDRRGTAVLSAACEHTGGSPGGTLTTYNARQEQLVRLDANKIGQGRVTTFGARGHELVNLTSGSMGGMVSTLGEHGRELVRLGSVAGEGTIRTFNAEGQILVNLGVTSGGQGAVATYDGHGLPLVQLGATARDGRAAISLEDGLNARPAVQIFIGDRGEGKLIALGADGEGRGLTPSGMLPVKPAPTIAARSE
jgi:hypothetical protein